MGRLGHAHRHRDQESTFQTYRNVGGAWTLLDSYTTPGGGHACAEVNGALYVAGIKAGDCVVRRSTNGGTSWGTVDVDTACTRVTDIGPGPGGRVYWVGASPDNWFVRRSSATTWLDSDRLATAGSVARGYACNPVTDAASVVGEDNSDGTNVRRLVMWH